MHHFRFGEHLQVVWQLVAEDQARRFALILFEVPKVAAVLGAPDPSRNG
jgi:hypothetical protein